MADNTTLSSGSGGDTLRTDDISGVKFPTSKITLGADGTDDGFVSSANPLPVSASALPLPTGAATLAEQQSQTTALQIMDDWDESDRAKVNVIAGQAGITAGAGAVAANTPRVTLASDDPAVAALQTLDNIVSGNEAQVDIVTMPAITGTVTANAGTNLNTSALALESGGNLATAASKLTDIYTDVNTSMTTLSNIQTAVEKIDNPVFVDDAAFAIGTSSAMVAGGVVDESSTDSADEGDAVALRATANRQLIVTQRPNANGEGLDIFRSVDLDESEEEVKASAGKVYGWFVANLASSARYVKFYNATAANVTVGSTTPVLTLPIPASASGHVEFANGIPFSTAISVAATTGVADADTGAPGANEIVINVLYK